MIAPIFQTGKRIHPPPRSGPGRRLTAPRTLPAENTDTCTCSHLLLSGKQNNGPPIELEHCLFVTFS